ncbi:hypothetical protein [Lonepinella sp. BR2271]|uniref:hypothetical protein n=1 Tax=Lonepinella sp. BR2271 TaxID=3434550 RepID=UPI003F6DA866
MKSLHNFKDLATLLEQETARPKTIEIINISKPEIDEFFYEISAILLDKSIDDIKEQYIYDLATLINTWQVQGFVEVYHQDSDAKHGRIKPSHINAKGSITPLYIGLYHARVQYNQNDPLLIVTFEPDQTSSNDNKQTPIIRFLIDHNSMFVHFNEKHQQQIMHKIHQTINKLINAPEHYQDIL